jgi:hypothetical protein
MKKYLFIIAFVVASPVLFSQAPGESVIIKGTKKISEKMTPQQVIDSLHEHFPDAKAVKYYKMHADIANRGWAISREDNLDAGDEIDYYTLTFTSDNLEYYGLYDKEGKLLVSKVVETMANLPEPIASSLTTLGQLYPGYKVISKTYFKHHNYSRSEEYYEVVAKKGNKKKTLYYLPDGTLTKVKG